MDKYNGAFDPYIWGDFLSSYSESDTPKYSLQNKNELAFLLGYLYYRREEIEHYIEVGVHKCGTFFVIDQFLRTVAKNYKYGIAIDGWYKTFTDFGLNKYKEKMPGTICLKQEIQNLKNYSFPNKSFVFIDCAHTYSLTKCAFEILKKYALFIVLDDVTNSNYPEMSIYWNELKQNYNTKTYNTFDQKRTVGNGHGFVLDPMK